MATTTQTDVLADNTTVRYEGSAAEFRGLYGRVETSYLWHGKTRYNIALSDGPNRGTLQLFLVRRTSLVPGDNNG